MGVPAEPIAPAPIDPAPLVTPVAPDLTPTTSPYFNPKVVYGALAAALVGGLLPVATLLEAGLPTTKVLLLAVLSAFVTGFSSGLVGWFKKQDNWKPPG